MKICSVEDCDGGVRARGYCGMHYRRVLKYGDPLAFRNTSDPECAFAKRTRPAEGGCLEWVGAISSGGYGHMLVNGKLTRAHRYAWERTNGPIPEGVFVDHVCHNRLCVNVDHLRLATRKQNGEHLIMNSRNSSGYRGVSWDRRASKWVAGVRHNNKTHHLGYYSDAEEAAEAARLKRVDLFTHNDLDRV